MIRSPAMAAAWIGLALWPALAGAWDLDPAASAIRVASLKNDSLSESHSFTDLTGAVAENGAALVAIGLGSIDTGVAIRDERMREMLFDLPAHPFALVTTRVDLSGLEDLAVGAVREIAAPIRVEANGVSVETDAILRIARVGPDRVAVATAEPVAVDVRTFGFGAGVEALRAVAGLDAIAPIVPTSVWLVFDR
jgi:hypothetical protein